MATLPSFSPPAHQNESDFSGKPAQNAAFLAQWNTNVNGWTQQAIFGNPWNATNAANQSYYYNPLVTNIPDGSASVLVDWVAFPNRMSQYMGQSQSPANPYGFTQADLYQRADTSNFSQSDGKPIHIPHDLCPQANWNGPLNPYGPYGPRGWLDEYCEWSVTRNADGKITRIDFVCENPEYWHTLWMIDPELAAQLYQQTLNFEVPADQQITVTVEDLQLTDPTTGQPVIDPSTGRPAYNGLNKWNSGPVSQRTPGSAFTGGAMHLTSTPNTLQTEMGLAGAATVQRQSGNFDTQQLICCSQYGQPYRHSDPHIGQMANIVVSGGSLLSLADPVGLYIQMPQFDTFAYQLPDDPKLPAGAKVSDCWHIVRGQETMVDPVTNAPYPGNMILHAVFQIPKAWRDAGVSFTIGDITIGGTPISWGGQVAQTMHIGLYVRPIPASQPAPALACVGTPTVSLAQPLQMFPRDVWVADYNTQIPNPVNVPMSLASNSTMIAPIVEQGASGIQLALTYAPGDNEPSGPPQVRVPEGDLTFTSQSVQAVSYAVPGNTYPSNSNVLYLTLDVPATAQLGLRNIQITDKDGNWGPAAPAFLNVVKPGTINA